MANAEKNWINHYKMWHPNSEFLNLINKKLCNVNFCKSVISLNDDLCNLHKNEQNYYQLNSNNNDMEIDNGSDDDGKDDMKSGNDFNNNINDNNYLVIDGGQAEFDMRKLMKYYDINTTILDDIKKDKIAKLLINALRKIAGADKNIRKALDGAIELRLIAPTFLYTPHRQNDIEHNKQEALLREKLFIEKKWAELVNRIDYEQAKRNAKMDRKNKKLLSEINGNNDNNNNIINDGNKKNILNPIGNENKLNFDGIDLELKKIETQNLLNINSIINESDGLLNNNVLAHKINKIRYGDYDKPKDIKQRIKRCVKEAGKSSFKKADGALNVGIIVNLNINNN